MNRPDVMDDLNVNYEEEYYQTWDFCTDRITYTQTTTGSIGLYDEIKATGIRILHYSGNTDLTVPTTGTREWIYQKGWTINTDWIPYYIKDGKQVGGYVEERDGLTFATVQGVGHFSAQWKPQAVFYLINKFIDNQPIPN